MVGMKIYRKKYGFFQILVSRHFVSSEKDVQGKGGHGKHERGGRGVRGK